MAGHPQLRHPRGDGTKGRRKKNALANFKQAAIGCLKVRPPGIAATLLSGGTATTLVRLGPLGLTDPEGDRIHHVGLGNPPERGMVSLSLSGS